MQQLTTLLPNSNHCSPVGCVQQISTFTIPQINFPDPNPETWKFLIEQKFQANHFNLSLENMPALEISDRRERCSMPAEEGGAQGLPQERQAISQAVFCPVSPQ